MLVVCKHNACYCVQATMETMEKGTSVAVKRPGKLMSWSIRTTCVRHKLQLSLLSIDRPSVRPSFVRLIITTSSTTYYSNNCKLCVRCPDPAFMDPWVKHDKWSLRNPWIPLPSSKVPSVNYTVRYWWSQLGWKVCDLLFSRVRPWSGYWMWIGPPNIR
jgi:hypothetical protein